MGLFVSEETGITCIINKASVGFLRPCDVLERLYLDSTLKARCVEEDCLAELSVLSAGKDHTLIQSQVSYLSLLLVKITP